MKRFLVIAPIGLLFSGYGCGADPLYPEESDVITTIRAEGSEFSDHKTYVLPEDIVDLCLQPSSGTPSYEALGGAGGGASLDPANCREVNHSLDPAILEALEANMEKLGYERIPEAERDSADLALLVGLISRTSWLLNRPYCYPSSYYGGCVDPLSDEPIVLPNSALLVQLIDVKASSDDKLSSSWTTAIHQFQLIRQRLGSSLGGADAVSAGAIMEAAIDQAFAQSTYLGTGQ